MGTCFQVPQGLKGTYETLKLGIWLIPHEILELMDDIVAQDEENMKKGEKD